MAKLELKKVIKFNSLCPGCSDHTRYSRFHRYVDVVGIGSLHHTHTELGDNRENSKSLY